MTWFQALLKGHQRSGCVCLCYLAAQPEQGDYTSSSKNALDSLTHLCKSMISLSFAVALTSAKIKMFEDHRKSGNSACSRPFQDTVRVVLMT